ncbi:MAG: hypothetical protein AAGB22_02355, partial [Bacteroidota bacterium]
MLRFLTILTVLSCTVAGSFAQVSYRTTPFESAPVRIFDPATAPPDFQPTVTHLEAPSPDGQGMSAYRARKQQEVRALYPLRPVQRAAKNTGDTLIQGRNFSTNLWALPDNPLVGGTPNDNTLAISDGNMLLTSWNSRVWGYDLDA